MAHSCFGSKVDLCHLERPSRLQAALGKVDKKSKGNNKLITQ